MGADSTLGSLSWHCPGVDPAEAKLKMQQEYHNGMEHDMQQLLSWSSLRLHVVEPSPLAACPKATGRVLAGLAVLPFVE